MGIPHLIATLEPFAVHDILDDQSVVIDGPALAYHILHVCNRNGVALPSYRLLGETTIAWLNELTSRRVSVEAIYFDGHLPLAKRPVRLERMTKSFHQLKLAHSADTKGRSRMYLSSPNTLASQVLFAPKPHPRKPFPPPTFHVPAVIEALRSSPLYQKLVLLVPGEADAYCAKHVLDSGSAILTSDSDLLAHDLGHGRVIFFRDVYLDGDSRLACAAFSPAQICERLGLSPSSQICRLAYERKRNPHLSLPQIQQECSKLIGDEVCYQEFCQEYLHHDIAQWPESLQVDLLDPRLSELVVQYRLPGEAGDPQQNKMYLPILIEDPTRGSAWEQSTSIRQLAYTILRWIIPGQSSLIHEYRRVNNTVQKGRQVPIMSKTSAEEFVESLMDLIKTIKKTTKDDMDMTWYVLGLTLDIRHCCEEEKQSHVFHMIQRVPTINHDRVSWDVFHFAAQIQAAYYSLRILQQILKLVLVKTMAPELHDALDSLPPLAEFPDIDWVLERLSQENGAGILRMVKTLVPLPDEAVKKTTRTSQKTPRPTKQTASTSISSTGVKRPTMRNPFEVLCQDD